MAIIRGTTPTVTFTFSDVDITDIAVAFLVIKQNDRKMIEKDISTATAGQHSLAWTLSQTETLMLSRGTDAKIFCDWRTVNGTRGRSVLKVEKVEDTGKNEVI